MKKVKYIIEIIAIFLLVGLDQITKYLAVANLKGKKSFVIWDGVFELAYVENRGAAFGIFQNQKWMFLILTTVIIILLCYIIWKMPQEKKFIPIEIIAVFILSGAIGNMIDRMVLGYVVDFFYFCLIDFPVFNVADCYVTVSCIVLFLMAFLYKEEDLDRIWPFGKK